MNSKISRRDHYLHYFTREEFKVRQSNCELEYEYSRAFQLFRTPDQTPSPIAKKFKDFFPDWPEQNWQKVPKGQKDKFTEYCFPLPIGMPDEQNAIEDPQVPKQELRETIWIDLSFDDREIRASLKLFLEHLRKDQNSLPPKRTEVGGKATLAKIKLKLTHLNEVTSRLSNPGHRIQAPRLLRASQNVLSDPGTTA